MCDCSSTKSLCVVLHEYYKSAYQLHRANKAVSCTDKVRLLRGGIGNYECCPDGARIPECGANLFGPKYLKEKNEIRFLRGKNRE